MLQNNKFQWFSENVSLPDLQYDRLEQWLTLVAERHNKLVGELSYIFCDDPKILEVNRQFLQHDYFTDIITFDYCRGKLLRGDMFISLETVATNAEIQGCSFENELLRVIVHGVLHLCGINDKGPGEREIMEANEDESLVLLCNLQKNCDI